MIRMAEDSQGVGEGRATISPVSSEPPTISVVICAYTRDRLEVLSEAVESLRAQTFPAHEIVLVSESGIRTAEDLARIKACGVDAVLIGEALMRGQTALLQKNGS